MIAPPTDNLYKFVAIGGILVCISCGWLFYSTANSALLLEARVINAKQAEGEVLVEDISFYEFLTHESILKTSLLECFWYSLIFVGLFGFLLSVAGFVLWYFMVQRHLDAKLSREAQKAKCEARTAVDWGSE
ncbi:MAG: hypothetical protein AB8B50_19665 [Pirellulaceae bacterium]